MLINYWIDIFTEENNVPEILYKFSTADKEGYIRCLDGSSFSSISQQNAIVRGGELSTMGKVEITIMSEDIIEPLDYNGGDLLGAYVSMHYQLGETDARTVFNKMQVVEFAQKSENSFVLSLEDSTFAKAIPCLLKLPAQAEESGTLSTHIGEQVWLPLKKLPKYKIVYGQGRSGDYCDFQRDLEGYLPKRNGKPAFPQLFYLSATEKNGEPAFIIGGSPQISSTEKGQILEVCAGKGKGDEYKIEDVDVSNGIELKLSPDWEDKVQQYSSPSSDNSFFRIINGIQFYYVSTWKNTSASDNFNFQLLRDGDGYKIFVEKSENSENNVSYDLLRVAPRYDIPSTSELFDFEFEGYYYYGIYTEEDEEPQVERIFKENGEPARLISEAFTEPEPVLRITNLRSILHPEYFIWLKNYNDAFYPEQNYTCNAYVSVYWRLDDIGGLEEIDSIQPDFNVILKRKLNEDIDIYNRESGFDEYGNGYAAEINSILSIEASLLNDNNTVMEVKNFSTGRYFSNRRYNYAEYHNPQLIMSDEMKEALTFSGQSAYITNAKYLHLRIKFELFDSENHNTLDICFIAHGLRCKYIHSKQLDVKITRNESIRNPVQLAQILCKDNSINTDISSMEETSYAITQDIYKSQSIEYPSIEVTNGAIWEEKLSELCRAANFSLFSDGNNLYAKYWANDRTKEIEWVIGEEDIVANSYDITSPDAGYIATDYAFSVPTSNGTKNLNFSAPDKDDDFSNSWEYEVDIEYKCDLFSGNYYEDYGILSVINENSQSQRMYLVPGNIFEINYRSINGIFKLLDIRFKPSEIDCIFEHISGQMVFKLSDASLQEYDDDENENATIKLLKNRKGWEEELGSNYPIKPASAESLWELSKEAFDTIKRHIKIDERYTKHKVMAFTNPDTWIESILRTVEHNVYKKVLVKFSIPLDMLPPDNKLSDLILKRVRLEFGWFKKRPIDGWIIGYSLNVTEDKVDITFISSERMKDIKWYDENYIENPTVLDETENLDKIIVEA